MYLTEVQSLAEVAYNTVMTVILALAAVFLLLVISELWWRRQPEHQEFTRKFVHITVGSFVAFWPYIMTRQQIILLGIAFIVVVALSRFLNIFGAIHSVQRPTLGELWFALTVCILAVLPLHPHVFTVALLEMSLADGLAAVVGTRYGKKNSYKVFGATKSVAGTATFFVVSCVLLLGFYAITIDNSFTAWMLPIALLATLAENAFGWGLDNLFVPVLIAVFLNAGF